LLTRLSGPREQEAIWHGEADCFSALEIDDQFEFCWLLHRQFSGLNGAERGFCDTHPSRMDFADD
jgi:hypothetical protein